jgi:isopentenyl diphosphate isomerase/L-lactate dehydrogenase-like FMN-dependent dehydrogenase
MSATLESRRNFLRYLAASPLTRTLAAGVAGPALLNSVFQTANAQQLDRAEIDALSQAERLIRAVDEAVNVFDFEPVLKAQVNPAHYDYMAQGADDGTIMRANRAGFDRYQLLPRRLVDVRNVDMSVQIFGETYDQPIFIAPAGTHTMFHPDGELAVARASRSKNGLMVLSTVTNYAVEEVVEARDAPIWFQLYPTSDWNVTRGMIQRAERAGCKALALTVDLPARNLEKSARYRRDTDPVCQSCHTPGANWGPKPMFNGIDMSQVGMGIGGLTWDYVDRLKDATSMQVLVKGIVTAEDANSCLEHGADGIIVSNHGGRSSSDNRSTIEALPEIVELVAGRVPVVIDSGFRRGTDVFKALALGADAICIGRPYLWGLGAFGQPGVEKVYDLLTRELRIVMQQMGATSLANIRRESVRTA